jgi:hypothetical protein
MMLRRCVSRGLTGAGAQLRSAVALCPQQPAQVRLQCQPEWSRNLNTVVNAETVKDDPELVTVTKKDGVATFTVSERCIVFVIVVVVVATRECIAGH